MTQEEKELLLRDLLPRLQYGVKIQTWYGEIIISDINTFSIGYDEIDIEQLAGMKPYLRPMSSMTKEEQNECINLIDIISSPSYESDKISKIIDCLNENIQLMDWFNKKMFDYRGLINKGLALEAPEDMYNTKTE